MLFRDLAFENDHRKEQKEGKLPVFNKEYHLAQLYLYHLGEKFVLDGCGKLTIFVKYRKDKPKYTYWDFEGISTYYLDDNQVDLYFNAEDEVEADKLLCDYTHDALIDIAIRSNCNEEIINKIHNARDVIINGDFSLSYEIGKCSKTNRSRKYRALVFRNISRKLAETWSVRIIDNNNQIIHEDYLSHSPLYFNGGYRYQKTFWEGNTFVLMDKDGIVWDRIEV